MLIFQVIVGLLFLLAITDLIVGVSNDAVNFLNSAIGSKVASFRTILIIASVGVLLGTLFSNGMMQIARNGIFQPEFFTFEKVMIIFLAVMLTDVILLDIYNTLGLPTSTTVSLIFELLGASLTVGVLYLLEQSQPVSELENVLNYRNALVIIGGIFFSVFIAFATGTTIHFFTRLLFTFRLKKSVRLFGPLFTGLAITTITYFLLIKGLEGSTLVTPAQLEWIQLHTLQIIAGSFLAISGITWILMRSIDFNPLKVIVLLGTFSLAMAFAGNDLVNFIGVSVAAFSSYQLWADSATAPEAFNMGVLNQEIGTPAWILLGAGVLMVLTLWFNAKSRKVTETEVSLGRQDEGDERFSANPFSRWLVGGSIFLGNRVLKLLPGNWTHTLEKRLRKPKEKKKNLDSPSFDLLRASVNLVVSSALIAFGTSQKLPLSTTFVTFMVAMGTSFADQAWGRESAVYRVSGVLQVIGGWVLTALVAFAGSAIVALFLYFTGFAGVIIVAVLALGLLIGSQVVFQRKQREENIADALIQQELITVRELLDQSKLRAGDNLQRISKLLNLSWSALSQDDQKALPFQQLEVRRLAMENERISNKIIKYIRKTERGGLPAGRLNLQVFDLLQDLYQSSLLISDVVSKHVINLHAPPDKRFLSILQQLESDLSPFWKGLKQGIEELNFEDREKVEQQYAKLTRFLQQKLDEEIHRIQQNEVSNRLATLQTRILLEMTDIIATAHRLYELYYDFARQPAS
jgi:phosphate/sulfate permease